MNLRNTQADIRAQRAHLLDRISMDDEGTECVECRARMLATCLAFTLAIGLTGLVAYRMGKSHGGA